MSGGAGIWLHVGWLSATHSERGQWMRRGGRGRSGRSNRQVSVCGRGAGTRATGSSAGDRLCRNARNAPGAQSTGPAATALAPSWPSARRAAGGHRSIFGAGEARSTPLLPCLHAAERAAEGKRGSSLWLQLAFRLGFCCIGLQDHEFGGDGSVAKVTDHCTRFLASLVCRV